MVSGFSPWKGKILRADVAAQGLKGVPFHQLFFGEQIQPLARYPNADLNDPIAGGWAYVAGEPVPMYKNLPQDSKRILHSKPQDQRHWTNCTDAEIFIFPRFNWWNNIVPVASVDRNNAAITLGKDCSYAIRPNDRYFVQNALEELDAPGEWYLDHSNSLLYFWPPASISSREITVPVLDSLVRLGPGTTDVTLRGLSLSHCVKTAVILDKTTNCLVAGCTIRGVGDFNGSGVSVDGGTSNGVVGNDISMTGRHGISLSGGDKTALVEADNHADNNLIHHTGMYFKQGVGIDLAGCGNRASHNLIHHEPGVAIQAFGTKHLIEYNHLHDLSLETEDTGAVYTSGRDWIGGRGTVIRYNFIHDVSGFGQKNAGSTNPAHPPVWQKGYFAWGIYLDDDSAGVDVIGNVVVRCSRSCLQLHNARDTVVRDNIFIAGGEHGTEYGGWIKEGDPWKRFYPGMMTNWLAVKDLPAWQGMRNISLSPDEVIQTNGMVMTYNQFFCNIVDERKKGAVLYRRNRVPLDKNPSDFNVVWQEDEASVKIDPRPAGALSNVIPWSNWKALGQDLHSMVADPLFVDASRDNYHLRACSPAFDLGFRESPLDKIGPYNDESRATWPIKDP